MELPQCMIDDGCEIIEGVDAMFKGFRTMEPESIKFSTSIILIRYRTIVFVVSKGMLNQQKFLPAYWTAIKPLFDKYIDYGNTYP